MSKHARNRWLWAAAAGVPASAILGLWVGAVYLRLVGLEVAVEDAKAAVEAAAGNRAAVVANAIHACLAFGWLDPADVQALRAAEECAGSVALGDAVEADIALREFVTAQRALTVTLDEFWATVPGQTTNPEVLDLRKRLDRADTVLEASLAVLESQLDAYRASRSEFPGAVVAGLSSGDAAATFRSWFAKRDASAGATRPR